jgi:hypothetical protein
MNRDELLLGYFDIDVSGNDDDGLNQHYIRVNPELITKNKATEFIFVMDTLLPEWNTDSLEGGQSKFTLEGVAYDQNRQMCICTQPITDICYLRHPLLNISLQVGNTCVHKVSPELAKEAENLLRTLKKEHQEAHKKKWDDYNTLLKKYHMEREIRLNKERDELVKQVEKEYDEQMFMRKHFNHLQVRFSKAETCFQFLIETFRQCKECKRLSIPTSEPSFKTKCITCYKK